MSSNHQHQAPIWEDPSQESLLSSDPFQIEYDYRQKRLDPAYVRPRSSRQKKDQHYQEIREDQSEEGRLSKPRKAKKVIKGKVYSQESQRRRQINARYKGSFHLAIMDDQYIMKWQDLWNNEVMYRKGINDVGMLTALGIPIEEQGRELDEFPPQENRQMVEVAVQAQAEPTNTENNPSSIPTMEEKNELLAQYDACEELMPSYNYIFRHDEDSFFSYDHLMDKRSE